MDHILIGTHLFTLLPFSNIHHFNMSKPERIGDDSLIVATITAVGTNREIGVESKVRLLFKNHKHYLVDFHNLKAWPYPEKDQ